MSGLKTPRRKRRVYQQLDSPFPIPIESITKKPASSSRWFYYTGLLKDNCVLVQQEGDVIFLYKMGFFGKGMMSKSKPEHNIFLNSYQGLHKKNLPPKERRFQQQRFQQVRKNRYERHLSWSKQFVRQSQNVESGGVEDTATSVHSPSASMDISESESCLRGGSGLTYPAKLTTETDDNCTVSSDVIAKSDEVTAETDDVTFQTDDTTSYDVTVTDDSCSKFDNGMRPRTSDFITRASDVTTRTSDVTTTTSDVTTRTADVTARTSDVTTRTSDVTTRTADVTTRTSDVTTRTSDVTTRTSDVTTRTSDVTTTTSDVTTRTADVTARTSDVTTQTSDVTTRTADVTTRTSDVTTRTSDVTTRTSDVTTRTSDVTTTTNDVTTRTDDVTTTCDDATKVCRTSETSSELRRDCDGDSSSADESARTLDSDKQLQSETSFTMETALAGSEDTEFQVSSSTSPEGEGVGTGEEIEDQGLIRKKDPYQIHEYLHLKFEEAFFLSYGLGCLSVMDEKRPLDLTAMWQTFCSRQKNFIASYVAYHYFRSKGWVPRDGIKYGAHYVLYKHGPPFYHGSYSVIVKMVTEGSWDSNDAMTWPALSGMDRITETVAKEVMFCYVIRPSDLSDQNMQSPRCIPRFRVQEIIMKRWVSSRGRDLKDQLPPLIS